MKPGLALRFAVVLFRRPAGIYRRCMRFGVLAFLLLACRDPDASRHSDARPAPPRTQADSSAAGGAESPELAVRALRSAWERRDGNAYLALVKPSLRDKFLATMLTMWIPDDRLDEPVAALRARYGVVDDRIPKDADRPALMTELLHIHAGLSMVRYVRGCIYYEPRGPFAPESWEFERVEIDGCEARAIASARWWDHRFTNEYFLTRTGDRWYFNLRPLAGAKGLAALEDQAAVRVPRVAARVMIEDRTFGARTVDVAIAYGNRILDPLREASKDFEALDDRNAFWIAEVLAAVQTKRCRALLDELWSRDRPYDRMVAAVALAAHGAYPEPLDDDSLLVRTARQRPSAPGDIEALTELAVIGLGKTGDQRMTPILAGILRSDPRSYSIEAYACGSLTALGSPAAIEILRDCLRREDFWALPEALRGLIRLGDPTAVPLAIRRIDPSLEGTNSGLIVDELAEVTGQRFGHDRDRWMKWWSSVQGEWRIPERLLKQGRARDTNGR